MEFITDNLEHIQDDIDELVGDGDMLIIDCPGQIELYTHLQPIQIFIEMLTKLGFGLCCIHCLDINFMQESNKFISGAMTCLSSMLLLSLPHINVITKCDLLGSKLKNK
jgi:hypothetical protein